MTSNLKRKRLLWLDVAKGMAIILVVLGHSALPPVLNRLIFAFHMPFFFLASGYSSVFDKYCLEDYMKRKVKVLLFPFLIYSFINLLLQPYVSDMSYQEYWMQFLELGWLGVPLWFIPVLFLALLIAKMFFMINNRKLRFVLFLLLPFMSISLRYTNIWLPWNLSVVPYAAFLIVLGNYLACITIRSNKYKNTKSQLLVMILCFLVTATISYYWKLDMCWNNILPFLPLLIGALAGTAFLSLLAILIDKHSTSISRVLQSVGKETYLILAFAEIIIVYLNYFFELNSFIKYILLIIILFVLCQIKNVAIRIVNK